MAGTYPFPFVGAGDATYFEWAEVHVVFEREPTKQERAAIKKAVPPPLADSIDFSGTVLMVASGQDAHVVIAETYPKHKGDKSGDDGGDDDFDDDDEYSGDGRFFFAASSQVDKFNAATDEWLKLAHAQTPIRLAFRHEDSESGGTELSDWHEWSVKQVPAIVAHYDLATVGKQGPAWALRGALGMAKEARIKLTPAQQDFVDPERMIKRTLDAGTSIEDLLDDECDNWDEIADLVDVDKPKHRAALCAAAPTILRKVNDNIDLLSKLAVAAVRSDHSSKAKVLAVVKREAAGIEDEIHSAAWEAHKAKRHDEALELFESIVYAKGLNDLIYNNALFVLMNDKGKLRVTPQIAKKLLNQCLPYAKSNPSIHHNAACVYVALGDRNAALDEVEAAVKRGYDRKLLARDSWLKSLAKDPRWIAAVTPPKTKPAKSKSKSKSKSKAKPAKSKSKSKKRP